MASLTRVVIYHLLNFIVVHFPVQAAAPQVLTCFMDYYSIQCQQTYKVWYGHQCIHAIGQVPDHVKTDY